ncbi:hypothetical protein [Streptomyces sp. DSM 40484]|uniref:hypothetical protein n=1 Tax=Streptomyces kroppenstedtii TaxID=3051181 RepID=UPI0028D85D6F|nr:hypothetical protein [Streptomyces sp. DSM 40484]
MFKIQYRNAAGRMVTAQHHDRDEIQRLANKAVADCPETHELRVREIAADQATGDFIWSDCTAYFAPADQI